MNVTVAVPCYNGAAFVARAIETILDQSHPAYEILVVDDGSTDNSRDIITRYPVRLIQHEENRGLATARNTAIQAAVGDVIVFVDADAYADHELLASLLEGYDDPIVGGVGGQGIEVNIRSLEDRWRRAHASQNHGQQPATVPFLYGLCMSYRLQVLRMIGGFNPVFRTNAEDMDIGLRLTAAGYTLRYEPAARVYHQRTDDRSSIKRTMDMWYTAAYRAKRANGAQPWHLFLGTMKRLLTDPLEDVFVLKNPELAPLSLSIGMVKLKALVRALSHHKEQM